jgi:hypothetical protein
MTISSGGWVGARGIACAVDAKARAKATALNLIIASLPFDIGQKRNLLFRTSVDASLGRKIFDLDQSCPVYAMARSRRPQAPA